MRWVPAVLILLGCGAPPRAIDEGIRRLVLEAMAEDPSPGVSVAVQRAGEVLFAEGFGFADLENEVPATAATVYRIGSVTKQFTAAAAMLLVEEGKLDLAADFTDYLPDYDARGFRIPVERLLNHTSGIKGYTEMPEFWSRARLDLDHREMMDLFSAPPFEFEPGDRYQYNNSGYYLLGVLLERLSGASYAAFLEKRFFEPLALRDTHYLDNDPIIPGRAEGYEALPGGGFRNDDPVSMRLPYAAGSLGSSVLDLLAWQRALVEGRAVRPESRDRMTARGELIGGEPIDYGYGLGLGREHDLAKISHGGGINGFRAQLAWYPDVQLGIAVLANAGSARPGLLENRIAREVLGLPQPVVAEVEVSPDELEACAGTWNSGRSPVTLAVEDGELRGFGARLVPVGDGRFHPERDPFRLVECGEDLHVSAGGVRTRFRRVPE